MSFLKKRMKSWLSQGSSVSRGTRPPCKQGLTFAVPIVVFQSKILLFCPKKCTFLVQSIILSVQIVLFSVENLTFSVQNVTVQSKTFFMQAKCTYIHTYIHSLFRHTNAIKIQSRKEKWRGDLKKL